MSWIVAIALLVVGSIAIYKMIDAKDFFDDDK